MKEHVIQLRHLDGRTSECRLRYSNEFPWPIEAESPVFGRKTAAGGDLFQSLRMIRKEVEPAGWRFLCNGARVDTWPSGLLSDMIGARRLLVMSIVDRPHTPDDEVDIFDPADPALVGTTDEQKSFRDRVLEMP